MGALPVPAVRPGAIPAATLETLPVQAPAWTRAALSGRLIELSAGAQAAQLTAAVGLVLDTQLAGDQAAWITLEQSVFFPPDVVDGGVDLDALPVVRVPDLRMAGRAADCLVRSGAFGLIVIDLSSSPAASGTRREPDTLPVPLLTRLLGLARQHDAAVLLLTKKAHDTPSIHSLISLRVDACWRRQDERDELLVRALKDKRRGPGWTYAEVCRGPAGLR